MKDAQFEPEPRFSQLLDDVEERLEKTAMALSQTSVTIPVSETESRNVGSAAIDNAVLRLSTILRRARNIKNSLSPINQIPPEILAHIVTFLPLECDLINATAICQHWRTILLSFPRFWCSPRGSPSKLRAYIQRSKSAPIDVSLSSPELAELIVPYASRLVGLSVKFGESHSFSRVINHLPYPIPTLHTLRLIAPKMNAFAFPSDQNPFCLHLKKLEIVGVLAFRGNQTFSCVTELKMHMDIHFSWEIKSLLNTLERFPVLERVYITFHGEKLHPGSNLNVVTLPHVQEMELSPFIEPGVSPQIPSILEYLQLPNLKSLSLRVAPRAVIFRPVFPITSFGERLPTLAELAEVRVKLGTPIGETTFQSSSQATLKHLAGPFTNYVLQEGRAWRGLPLHSVRRLIVDMVSPPSSQEVEWLVKLLGDLRFLEDLEIGGNCDRALGRLRRDRCNMISLSIQTLTVRYRGEPERTQAAELKRSLDAAGLDVTLVCIPDPGD